jgi:hypothetical protein
MKGSVSVLNADFACINKVSTRRAKHMIENGKAFLVDYEGDLSDIRETSFVPKKIKLFDLAKGLYGKRLRFSKENMVERDGYRCVYCGASLTIKQLEIEHVVPSSKGGKTTWDNVASACHDCNQKKADRTPEEAGMSYFKKSYKPYQPMLYEFIVKRHKDPELDEWFKGYNG